MFLWVDHRLRWRHSAWVVWCKACKDSIMLEVVLVGGFGWFIMFSMLCLHPKQSPHCLYTSITKRCFIWELYYIVINLLHESFTNKYKFTSIITYLPHLHVSNGLPEKTAIGLGWHLWADVAKHQRYGSVAGIGIQLFFWSNDPTIHGWKTSTHKMFREIWEAGEIFEQRRQRWTPCIWEHRCQAVPWQIWRFRFTGVEYPNTQVMSQRMEGKKRKCHRLGN